MKFTATEKTLLYPIEKVLLYPIEKILYPIKYYPIEKALLKKFLYPIEKYSALSIFGIDHLRWPIGPMVHGLLRIVA